MECPLQIVNVEDGTFKLNSENLESIMSKIPLGVKVAVVSIIGSHRTGKSFLLNLFLRYLRSKRTKGEDKSSTAWIVEAGESLREGNANKINVKAPVKRDSITDGWGVQFVMDAIVDDEAAVAAAALSNNSSNATAAPESFNKSNSNNDSYSHSNSHSNSNDNSNSKSSSSSSSNIKESESAPKGYQWGGGSEPQTTGIWMWSEPFIRRTASSNDEDVAVLIMDTQGMFDNDTPISITAQIFGLSTLVSSFQVYNVEKRIGDDNFQHLALFSEYGRMALNYKENDERKLDGEWMEMENDRHRRRTVSDIQQNFQRLQFLIRDYQNFDDDVFDLFDDQSESERGKSMRKLESEMHEYFNSIFPEVCDFGGIRSSKTEASDIVYTRDQIRRSYKQIDCFMLPFPGAAMTKPSYEGLISRIDNSFIIMVNRYIRKLFDEELEPKIVNNQYIHGPELKLYFEVYASMLNNKYGQILTSSSLETAIQSNSLNAIMKSFEFYKVMMKRYSVDRKTSNRIYLKEKDFEVAHEESLADALNIFDSMAAIGSPDQLVTYKDQLKTKIDAERQELFYANNLLNPLKDMAGPDILKEKFSGVVEKLESLTGKSKSEVTTRVTDVSSEEQPSSFSGFSDADSFWKTHVDADAIPATGRARKTSFSPEEGSDGADTSSFVIKTISSSDQYTSLETLVEVASSLYKQGKYNEALEKYFKAIRIIETYSDEDQSHENEEFSFVLCKIGQIYCAQKQFPAARENLDASIKIQRRILSSKNLTLANSLASLAVVHLYEQQFKTSLDLFGEVIQIRESALGSSHPLVVDSLHNISIAYEKMASFYEAGEHYEDALGGLKSALCIIEGLIGDEHNDKAVILNKMASNYICLNQHGNALDAYRESLRIRELVQGDSVVYWDNYACLFDIKQTSDIENVDILQDALDVKMALLGSEHMYVALIISNIAKAFEDQGMYTKATDYYSQSLLIEKALFGNQHLSVAETYVDMAIVSNLSGNLPTALQLMNEALAIKAAILSRDHIDYKEIHTLKMNIINSTKPRKGPASAKKRRVKKIYISVDNSFIQWTLSRIGVCEDKLKEGFKGAGSKLQKSNSGDENCIVS